MRRKRVIKHDLKAQLEELECEIALCEKRKRYRMLKLLKKKYNILSQQFIEENLKYYEQCTTG
jgi:hypothetical protein